MVRDDDLVSVQIHPCCVTVANKSAAPGAVLPFAPYREDMPPVSAASSTLRAPKNSPGEGAPKNSLTAELPLIAPDPPSLRRRSSFARNEEHRSETMSNTVTITGNLTREPELFWGCRVS